MTQPSRAEIVAQVLSMIDHSKGLFGERRPTQGQMVVTGIQMRGSPENRIGFCVQIRKNRGQFGSDMVFLRHPNEALTTHENQCYFAMTQEQEALARTLFTHLPQDEDYSHGYKCYDKVHEKGFLIENSASQPMPNTPFIVTVQGGDGGCERTMVMPD